MHYHIWQEDRVKWHSLSTKGTKHAYIAQTKEVEGNWPIFCVKHARGMFRGTEPMMDGFDRGPDAASGKEGGQIPFCTKGGREDYRRWVVCAK